jgi:hypothetical protein
MVKVGVKTVPDLIPNRASPAVVRMITRQLPLTTIGEDDALAVLPAANERQ